MNRGLLPLLLITSVLHVTPLYAESPLHEGFSLLEAGSYRAAFSRFSSIDPKTPPVRTGMGMARFFLNDFADAAVHFTAALNSPQERHKWTTNYFHGLALLETGDSRGAVGSLNKALALKKTPEVRFHLARALAKAGETAKADELLSSFPDSDPLFADAAAERVKLLARSGRSGDAFQLADRILARAPGNRTARYEKAKLLFAAGKLDEADKEFAMIGGSRSADMQAFYSSLKAKKTGAVKKSPVAGGEGPSDTGAPLSRAAVFAAAVTVAALLCMLGAAARRRAGREKLEYVNELLKRGDSAGAGEMLSSVPAGAVPADALVLADIRLRSLKNDLDGALERTAEIRDPSLRLLVQGIVMILAGRKNEIDAHCLLMEESGYGMRIAVLKKLVFQTRDDALRTLLEI